jgi:hypothetical protein
MMPEKGGEFPAREQPRPAEGRKNPLDCCQRIDYNLG